MVAPFLTHNPFFCYILSSFKKASSYPFDSGVSRLRPVAMAVTIIAGLLFATVLTMVVLPVLYAIFFRVKY